MHNMLAIYRHKGHSSRNSSPVISLILRNAEDDDIDNSTVNIKDDSNLGLFIGYLQSGTIRRSRQMHYHRNHLSPPLENQPNISRTVLAKCFWEMFNVSSFLRKTIPFISVHIQIGIGGMDPYFLLIGKREALRQPSEIHSHLGSLLHNRKNLNIKYSQEQKKDYIIVDCFFVDLHALLMQSRQFILNTEYFTPFIRILLNI